MKDLNKFNQINNWFTGLYSFYDLGLHFPHIKVEACNGIYQNAYKIGVLFKRQNHRMLTQNY